MTALRRAFLAVVPPPAVLGWAESAQRAAAAVMPDLRWTRTEQRHLTVKFFGPVPDLSSLAALVTAAVRARPPFTLALGGGGAFPSPRRASVLWIGASEGGEALSELAAPFAADARPFRAHVTLARVSRTRDLRAVVAALDACADSERWTVDELVLFDSDTRPDGAVHTEQARFGLAR